MLSPHLDAKSGRQEHPSTSRKCSALRTPPPLTLSSFLLSDRTSEKISWARDGTTPVDCGERYLSQERGLREPETDLY
jgi:hypothetical protein